MKLRNKKTGETGYLLVGKGSDHYVVTNDEWEDCGNYGSLAELNEEWEDYEEPKKYWLISPVDADVEQTEMDGDEVDAFNKQIGNYFETREEAEKAVEKLKAWKRLKDKGFEFKYIENNHIEFGSGYIDDVDQFTNDMALLFGGED